MNKILEEISKIGILPVVVLEDAKDAKPLTKALCAGGLPCAEVTFRTAAAKESIAIMRKEFPDMLVGAGTVLTVEQVDEALEAGAQFIISPGFDEDVVKHCIEKNVPVTPGTCTPSDVQKCYRLGLDVVKFFPANIYGGLKAIDALSKPFPNIKFLPTGGVNYDNIDEFLTHPNIYAVGGSFMMKGDIAENCKKLSKWLD